MPITPDFRLYHSNALDVLAGLLAAEVAKLPADGDWLRPDVVLVPQFSMRRWLQQALAERLGICANLTFLTPGEFVDFALDQNLGAAPEADRLAPETLRWHLLRELHAAPPAIAGRFLSGGDPLKPWSLANALAETYEKYQAWRRDWLLDWERNAHPRRAPTTGRPRCGAASPGSPAPCAPHRRLPAPRARTGRAAAAAVRVRVPEHLARRAAGDRQPGARGYAAFLPAHAGTRVLGRPRSLAGYTPADDDDFLGGPATQCTQSAARLVGPGRTRLRRRAGQRRIVPPAFELAPHATRRGTLLGRLQHDVLDNVDFRAFARATRLAAHRGRSADPSLQFHACHTRLREVQVLHDQLRALLEAEAPDGGARLQPRDIAVLAPDIDAYAPHIEAVFGGALGSAREIPYTIADTSPLANAPLAAAFLRLLDLPLRALTVTDVLDLLAVPAIAARFDLDDNERGALQDWLDAAGARWGLDAADRVRHGAQDDRLHLRIRARPPAAGLRAGADDDIAGVAPWPELEGQATDALDGLLRLLGCCARRARMADAKSAGGVGARADACSTPCSRARHDDAAALKACTRPSPPSRAARRSPLRGAGRTRGRARPLPPRTRRKPTRAHRSCPAASASAAWCRCG